MISKTYGIFGFKSYIKKNIMLFTHIFHNNWLYIHFLFTRSSWIVTLFFLEDEILLSCLFHGLNKIIIFAKYLKKYQLLAQRPFKSNFKIKISAMKIKLFIYLWNKKWTRPSQLDGWVLNSSSQLIPRKCKQVTNK